MINDPNGHELAPDEVSVAPTKALFVEMLTRDLRLDEAINDLVDNSIDGARRMRDEGSLEGLWVKIQFDADHFSIEDNCGGILIERARNYVFRFGKPRGTMPEKNSVGLFGVGMKRALFKFGRLFQVSSSTTSDSFTISVDVDDWENEQTAWTFKMAPYAEHETRAADSTGTAIAVRKLEDDAKNNFGDAPFETGLIRLLERSQQTYLKRGLGISCNGRYLIWSPWNLFETSEITPGFRDRAYTQDGKPPIRYRICVGIEESDPSKAGWYIICNGRAIVFANQDETTGWTRTSATVKAPKYHNQFARFRGYVFIDCEDPRLLPWNTTKDAIDVDSTVYQSIREDMIEMMRPVIDFLNALDNEDEEGPSKTPLHDALKSPRKVSVQDVAKQGTFKYPTPANGPAMANISYSVERDKVQDLQRELGVGTYKDLGLRTFGLAYDKFVGDK